MEKIRSLRIVAIISAMLLSPAVLLAQPGGPPIPQEMQQMRFFLDIMQEFFAIIDSMYQISANPEKSAIFQMHKIQEIYEQQGDKSQVIPVLRDVLTQSSNQTIRNATYMLLSEALKESGQNEEALEALRSGLNENIREAK